jgi:hypothetical protein
MVAERTKGRRWSWAALVGALLVWVGGLPTFGLSIFLSPLSILLSVVAWFRSPRDAVFWVGFALNALLLLGLVSLFIGDWFGW